MELKDESVLSIWDKRVQETPFAIGVEFEQVKLTYSQMDEYSDWLVHRFSCLGIEKETKAAIWCGNDLQWVLVYLGLMKIGAIAVLVNPNYKEVEVKKILNFADVEYLFYGQEYKGNDLTQIIKQMNNKDYPQLKQKIPMEENTVTQQDQLYIPQLTMGQRKKITQIKARILPKDLCGMLFTSGTTNRPKGVLLSHYSLVNNARATVLAMGWNKKDKFCVMVPFFHCFGLTSCLLSSIISGASLYILKNTRSIDALFAIEQEKCTVLNGVPSMFLALIHNHHRKEFDLSCLQSGIIAGSFVTREQYLKICDFLSLSRLQMSYGQTECSPAITFSSKQESVQEKATNVGYPLPHLDVCIFHQGQYLGVRGVNSQEPIVGEICVKGYSLMNGYYHQQEATNLAISREGYLHTGDLGYFDEKGRIHLQGRISEVIIRGGENISPIEIEECILQLKGVKECKVIGIPHQVLGEEIAACVVMEKPKEFSAKLIKQQVIKHLAYYKVPVMIFQFQELPVTVSGKIAQEELKRIVINIAKAK